MDPQATLDLICETALERKAEDITVLEMLNRSALCDFFVVMSAPSTVRVKAIVDHIEKTLTEHGHRPRHKEGYVEGVWVLLDFGPIIVHVFHQETRQFYGLEHLWGDAPRRQYSK